MEKNNFYQYSTIKLHWKLDNSVVIGILLFDRDSDDQLQCIMFDDVIDKTCKTFDLPKDLVYMTDYTKIKKNDIERLVMSHHNLIQFTKNTSIILDNPNNFSNIVKNYK